MTRGPLAAIAGFQGDVQFSVDSDVGYTMEGNFSVDVGNNCGAYIQTEMDGAWTFGNWHQVIGETTTQIDIANGLHELYPPQGQLSGIFLAGEIHGLYFRAELFSPVGCSGTSVDTGTGGLAVTFYENPYGCGDGYVAGTNECDDGNSTNGDGCDDMCKIETGFSCLGAHSSCDGILGDGLIRGNEQCDDGALIPGDGCEPNGMIESGASCTGEPSICSFLVPAMTERARLVLLVLFVVSTLVVRFNRREI
jgi:cysteine-rich repeat protein